MYTALRCDIRQYVIRLHPAAQTRVESFGNASLGGPWSLVDTNGRPMTSGDLLGRYVLIYFGFTFCPDICPNEMVKMGHAIDTYGAYLPAET